MSRRDLLFAACVAFGLAASTLFALRGVDAYVQLEQTDLYALDMQPLALEHGASAEQRFRAEDLTRLDVLAQSDEPERLRLSLLGQDGERIERSAVDVSPSAAPHFVTFIIPDRSGEGAYVARFDSLDPNTSLRVFGSACNCRDDGTGTWNRPGEDGTQPIQDLHLGTFTTRSAGERVSLVLDRLEAYTPGWLHRWTLLIAGLVLALGAVAAAVSVLARLPQSRSINSDVVLAAAVMLVPPLITNAMS